MTPVRVLIVDDAVVVRRVLSEALGNDPEIEVTGTAVNGRIALEKIEEMLPDIVVLDIEMPEMDGITTLREIRRRWRWLPVIMFSTLTERGAAATFDALAAGAADYVTKPSNAGSMQGAVGRIMGELAPKVKHLARRFASQNPGRPTPGSASATPARTTPTSGLTPPVRDRRVNDTRSGAPLRSAAPVASAPSLHSKEPIKLAPARNINTKVDAIAIGVSTGGPNALAALLALLQPNLGVPVLIVQHMPPIFTRMLAERLDRLCPLPVAEATGGMAVRPGHIYLAPGDLHLTLKRSGAIVATEVRADPPENSCRPSVDVLFRSMADVYGGNVLPIVLTGMGQDGFLGAQMLYEKGASILVQDEESSVVWGMPGFVARAGIAEAMLPVDKIAAEIVRRSFRDPLGTGTSHSAYGRTS
jgi:two-component system chemotaxis response regulator CheB